MADYIPNADRQFNDWLNNFIEVANTNLAMLGLSTTEMTALITEKDALEKGIAQSETAAAAAKAATEKKKLARKKVEATTRAYVKRIQAKPDVLANVKKQLQITVPGNTPAPPPVPYTPTDLIANIIGSGTNELTWKRNGNRNTVLFVVEAATDGETEYKSVFTTSKTNYVHAGNKPGAKVTYRIRAQHGTTLSLPSNEAVING